MTQGGKLVAQGVEHGRQVVERFRTPTNDNAAPNENPAEQFTNAGADTTQ